VTVTPAATTTYTLTATNSGGSVSATATITVAAAVVSVSVSPTTAALFAGGTQQFTATVTGTVKTSVTWTATGGTITTAGLFTAGQATGSFQVTATSTQDTSKSARATVNIVTQSSSDRPRMILDAPTLATLRSRVAANTLQWRALKSQCDSLLPGIVAFPDQG